MINSEFSLRLILEVDAHRLFKYQNNCAVNFLGIVFTVKLWEFDNYQIL